MNLFSLLETANAKFPHKTALMSPRSSYTYKELYDYSVILSRRLCNRFNLRGTNVVVHASNSNEYVILVNSLLLLNCTIVPVSTTCSDFELRYIMSETNPSIVFIDEFTGDKYKDIYYNMKNAVPFTQLKEIYFQMGNETSHLDNDLIAVQNDIAFIMYSSGSTGEIKGVMCPHNAVLFAITRINEVVPNTDKDVVLCALPFSFDYGLYQIFLVMNAFSTGVIINSIVNPLQIPSIIEKYNITGFPAVPMWLNILFETGKLDTSKMTRLKYLTSTGDTLRVKIACYLQDKLPNIQIIPMYGLTECKRVSILPPEQFKHHKDSVGLPLRGTTTRIVDCHGNDVPIGEVGELVVSGKHLMAGYYKDVLLTKQKYRYNKKNEEMELFTGDFFRKDFDGYLYFVSRTQFFIKKRDQRISPLVIEAYVNDLPGVIDSVIVPLRTEQKDDLIVCFVRMESNSNFDDLTTLIETKLPKLYRPNQIFCCKSIFPYSANGKVDRKKLIESAQLNLLQ